MSFSSTWRRGASVASLTLPIAIWFNRNVYFTHRVEGDSMEPALQDGDVLLVRRADVVLFHEVKSFLGLNQIVSIGRSNSNHQDHDNELAMAFQDESDRERTQQIDASVAVYPGNLVESPPMALPGQVVVFRSPNQFPRRNDVKRVVALGGQRVRPAERQRTLETVPPLNLWVEGDNAQHSQDSRTYGPISKKLVLGQPTMVLWPPSRAWTVRVVDRQRPPLGKSWWI